MTAAELAVYVETYIQSVGAPVALPALLETLAREGVADVYGSAVLAVGGVVLRDRLDRELWDALLRVLASGGVHARVGGLYVQLVVDESGVTS